MSPIRRLLLAALLLASLAWPTAALGAAPARASGSDERAAPAGSTGGSTAALAAGAPTAAPAGAGSLPKCRYQDLWTRHRRLSQWRITLLDTNLRIGRKYRPRDLVDVSEAGIGGSGRVRRIIVDDLRAMARAARKVGKGIAARSAFRDHRTQVAVFNGWVQQAGYQQALKYSARPGHSEHQLGTVIDFRSAASAAPPWDSSDWGQTPSGRWMRRNAWKYGFVMSYPAGKLREVCYGYEPWHWRYVGRRMAEEVHETGLTLRKFLWRRHERP